MNVKEINFNIIILILMIVTGCIVYFIYFQTIEKFTTTEPAPSTVPDPTDPTTEPTTEPTTVSVVPLCREPVSTLPTKSILSRYFGIGFNIDHINYNNDDVYLINHIPIVSNGTLGGCYGITQDNLLTIKLKNSKDNTLLWSISKYEDNNGDFFVINPVTNNKFALQYENGNLALRPYNSQKVFEGQKWLMSDTKITRSIPVLNYSPASLFTPEFDPYSTPSVNTNNMTDSNMQQITDVVNSVKTGIQQYLGQLDNKQQKEQISSSSLGNKDSPLNINFSIDSNSNTSKLSNDVFQKSNFKDTPESSTLNTDDFVSIMDKYGPSSSNNNNNNNVQLYKKNDLANELHKNQGCKMINMSDYTSNRVSSCNCKL